MNLIEAFSISSDQGYMISFVGGGGKTSAMFTLAKELRDQGYRILVTTTTSIYYPESSLYDHIFLLEDDSIKDKESLESLLMCNPDNRNQKSISVVGSHVTLEGDMKSELKSELKRELKSGLKSELKSKLKGVCANWVDEIFTRGIFDVILVEADGARGRPVKAPDHHEPVVPQTTSILTGMIGFDCYGREIDDCWVHRPNLLAEIGEKSIGDRIDNELILKLVQSHHGLFKNCPEGAKKILFFNKASDEASLSEAKKLGNQILNAVCDMDRILIGAVLEEEPIKAILKRG